MDVMFSIQPEWCYKIFNVIGTNFDKTPIYEKSVEVRKTIPKSPVPFRGLIYCTKKYDRSGDGYFQGKYCGKVMGEFICDDINQMYVGKVGNEKDKGYICLDTTSDVLRKQACLTEKQLYDYSNGSRVYGIHLSSVKLYDKPKELKEFGLNRAPQSWCYVKNTKEV